ncbi:helix-turn-helix domain-containing protein [Patescibacteria group bacterium]|nr:helix-turn-helix domain-containing protein [Patescibacteria group bacterium]
MEITLESDVQRLLFSLFNKNKHKTGLVSTIVYNASDNLKGSQSYYEHEDTIPFLTKNGLLKLAGKPEKHSEAIRDAYIVDYFFYEVSFSPQELQQYYLEQLNGQVKEPLGESEQLRKIITIIFDKQLEFRNKQIMISWSFIDQESFKNIQFDKMLQKLEKMGLVKISKTDVNEDSVDFTIETLSKLDDVYKEKGRYIDKPYIGNPSFHVDPLTGEFRWGDVKGKFDSLHSYQLGILLELLAKPNEQIKIEDLYTMVWKTKFQEHDRNTVKDTVKHLRERLGLVGKKENKPGYINCKYWRYSLYL